VSDRTGQVWEYAENDVIICVLKRALPNREWWTTLSLSTGRIHGWGTHTTHFLEWERLA
jgi:hypothetical protein